MRKRKTIIGWSRKMVNRLATVLIVVLLISCKRGAGEDCSIVKEGTFMYLDNINDPGAFFIIRGGRHIEYHNEKRYQIESNIVWLDECEYELEMISSNYENFPFRQGDRINIRIDAVRGDTIMYTASVHGGTNWTSRILKVGN